MEITPYKVASKFIGIHELPGVAFNAQIIAFLQVVMPDAQSDEIAWCSAMPNYIHWLLDLPRSHSAAARSWLRVGREITLAKAQIGYDLLVLKRGGTDEPGPEVINALGHVGYFAGMKDRDYVNCLAGNQHNAVNIEPFPIERVLSVRRVYDGT